MKYDFTVRPAAEKAIKEIVSNMSPAEAISLLCVTIQAVSTAESKYNTGIPALDRNHGIVSSSLTRMSIAVAQLEEMIYSSLNGKEHDFSKCDLAIKIAMIGRTEDISKINTLAMEVTTDMDNYSQEAPAPERIGKL